jgi:hypothetical protein
VIMAASSWVGSIPTWALFVLAMGIAYRLSRGGGSAAVSELSKANEVLTNRVHELGSEVRDLRVENAELKGRTDFALALEPILKWSISHEARAQERHEKSMVMFDLIAKHLGAEPNGN